MKPKELTQENVDAFNASKIPTEEEEEEAGKAFKVKKAGPRMMSPEEVQAEGPQKATWNQKTVPGVQAGAIPPTVTVVQGQKPMPKPIQPPVPAATHLEPDSEEYPDHQSFQLRPEPKTSAWQEGPYEAVIEKAWQLIEDDNFHKDPATGEPMKAVFMHVLYNVGGVTQEGRTSMSRHERSKLTELLTAIFGATPPIDPVSDDLVGRHVQIVIKNKVSKVTGNEYASVDGYLRSTQQFQPAGG